MVMPIPVSTASADRRVATRVRPSRSMPGSVSEAARAGQRFRADRNIGEGQGCLHPVQRRALAQVQVQVRGAAFDGGLTAAAELRSGAWLASVSADADPNSQINGATIATMARVTGRTIKPTPASIQPCCVCSAGAEGGGATGASGDSAGPESTSPFALKRDP